MKQISFIFALVLLLTTFSPIVKVNAARENKYLVSYSTVYDQEGSAFITINSTYVNYGSSVIPIRVNLKFGNLSQYKISEVKVNGRNYCEESVTKTGLVKYACGKDYLYRPYNILPHSSQTFTHTFKVDSSFVEKDKELNMEVIFKDGVEGNYDPRFMNTINLENRHFSYPQIKLNYEERLQKLVNSLV